MPHKMLRPLSLMTALLLALPSAMAASGERWEIQGTMTMPDAEPMEVGPTQDCLAPDWQDKPDFDWHAAEDCKALDVKRSGSQYSWRVQCSAGQGKGQAHLGRDSTEMEMYFVTPKGEYRLKTRSRRIGSCDPSTEASDD